MDTPVLPLSVCWEQWEDAYCNLQRHDGCDRGEHRSSWVSFVFPLFNSLVLKEQSKAKPKCLNKERNPVDEIPNICVAPLTGQCCVSQDCAQNPFLRILGFFFFCIASFLLSLTFFLLVTHLHPISTACLRRRSEKGSQAPCYCSLSFRNSKGEILPLLQ